MLTFRVTFDTLLLKGRQEKLNAVMLCIVDDGIMYQQLASL